MKGKYFDNIKISDELKASLEYLKECAENNYIYETGYSKELYDFINNLIEQLKAMDKYADDLWEQY